ncbi:MAG: hypothetical protein JWR34_5467 [Mycobacterium sp.]|nr:hypothetical protein [Mycobacterium sp.]
MSAIPQYSPFALGALAIFFVLWLGYCAWAWHKHEPDDAVRLIQAAGMFFPLRPRVPRVLSRRKGKKPK